MDVTLIAALLGLSLFTWAMFDWIDLIFISPPSGIKDGITRNLVGYLKMILGYLCLTI